MSNIDTRALREAAEKATPGPWGIARNGKTITSNQSHPVAVITEDFHRLLDNGKTGGDAEFIASANPATVLALLDELEAAENLAKQQGNIAVELFDEVTTLRRNADDKAPELRSQLEEAERRIAELEARTLVPVEPTLDQLVAGKRRLTSTGRMSRLMSQRLAEVYRAMVNAAAAGKGEAS